MVCAKLLSHDQQLISALLAYQNNGDAMLLFEKNEERLGIPFNVNVVVARLASSVGLPDSPWPAIVLAPCPEPARWNFSFLTWSGNPRLFLSSDDDAHVSSILALGLSSEADADIGASRIEIRDA